MKTDFDFEKLCGPDGGVGAGTCISRGMHILDLNVLHVKPQLPVLKVLRAVNRVFLISLFYHLPKYARNIPTMLSYDKKEAVLVILLNVTWGSLLAAE